MNRLEQLGFECAAAEWLELDRGAGQLLRLLIEAAGTVVRWDRLAVCYRGGGAATGRSATRNGLGVRIWRVREALADLGFGGCLETIRGVGLTMSPARAEAIRAAVLGRATCE